VLSSHYSVSVSLQGDHYLYETHRYSHLPQLHLFRS
jgi:hypothetical protein